MDIVEEVVEKVTLRQLKARYGNGIQYSVLQTAENSVKRPTRCSIQVTYIVYGKFSSLHRLSR